MYTVTHSLASIGTLVFGFCCRNTNKRCFLVFLLSCAPSENYVFCVYFLYDPTPYIYNF